MKKREKRKEKIKELKRKKIVLFRELFETEDIESISSINAEISALEMKIKKLR